MAKKKLSEEIRRQLDDEWLNLNPNTPIINPFERLKTEDPEEFYKRLTCLFLNPDYIYFVCKHVLNVELLPMQALILQEMWQRKFPMLVATRGFGKAVRPDEKIRIKNGWTTIKDIKVGDQVYSSNGKLCNVVYKTELQKNLKMYRVTLRDGRSIDCCEDHLWKVWDKYKNGKKDEIKWSELKTKDMVDSYKISRIGEKSSGFEYRYALPVNLPISEDDEKTFILHPYVVGVLLGDGCLTQKGITISSLDQEVLDRFVSLLPDGYTLRTTNNKDYRIIRLDKSVVPFHTLCEKTGILGYNSHTKFIPEEYKYSGVNNLTELLFGLMDTDGYSSKCGVIEYYTVSEKLKNDFLDVARSLGIQCREAIKEAWIGDRRYSDCYRVSLYTDKPVFSLPRKLRYLGHTKSKAGRSKYEKVFITNIERIEDSDGYCIQVDSPDHTYITKDYIVTHNTWMTSLYCLLRALLMPGRKIVVVGAAFRQSKFLHEYMSNIWKNAPVLRDMCSADSGPRASVDMCRMIINNSVVTSLPIGDGCVSPDTLTTYENSFGIIIDSKDNTDRIWGNGKFRDIDYFIDNGVKPTKKITTKKGFEFECTHNHALKVMRDGDIQWCRSDQMITGDRILIDRSIRWHNGNFECSQDQAYSLGAMIGDGCWTSKYSLGFASKDPEIVNRLNSGLNETIGKSFNQVEKDPVHFKLHGMNYVSKFLNFWGLKDKCYTIDKELPRNILSAPQSAMTACIQGLFDTDGHVTSSTAKGGISVSVNFTNTSKNLVRQLQYILLHYGIISKVTSRQRKTWNRVYQLGIYGNNAVIFAEKVGFSLPRKQTELLRSISLKSRSMSFDEDIPISIDSVLNSINRSNSVPEKFARSKLSKRKSLQRNLLKDLVQYCDNPDWLNLLDDSVFYDEIASIEDSESYTCDIHVPEGNEYCANGCFSHNSKIRGQRANDIVADEFGSHSREIFENVIAGFAAVSANPVENVKNFARQRAAERLGIDLNEYDERTTADTSNQIILSGTAYYDFNHFAEYWKKWRSIILTGGDEKLLSTNVFNGEPVPESFNWKDYSIIRIPVDLAPRKFMDEGQVARSKATVHNGIYLMEFAACSTGETEVVTSGGIKKIIDIELGDKVLTHRGRFRKVTKKTFRDYHGEIISIKTEGYNKTIEFTPDHPFWNGGEEFVPLRDMGDFLLLSGENGPIENRIVSKEVHKYTGRVYNIEVEEDNSYSLPNATVHNCFTTDSQGFFKRSLIESCVGTDSKPIHIGDESIYFDPLLKGNKNRKYVMAIDPASEVDNFSIIILELHGTHRRIVHCWTTTRSDHTEKVAKGITKVNNFYSYCARKIRDLMKLFNIVHIAMDSQGGGYSVSEALHDLTQLEDGEIPIWPIIDPEKEAPTDDQSGLHILEMCQFANYEWYSEANHGLRKDLENKTILFPRFDPITIGLSIEEDSANNRLYDTLEDCVMEIEELKNELSMIEITQSVNGRERWDTPEVKVGVSKKRRLRKDRYSALIMANLSARKIDIDAKPSEYHSYGGFSSRSEGKKQEGATYEGPNWFTSKINNLY